MAVTGSYVLQNDVPVVLLSNGEIDIHAADELIEELGIPVSVDAVIGPVPVDPDGIVTIFLIYVGYPILSLITQFVTYCRTEIL